MPMMSNVAISFDKCWVAYTCLKTADNALLNKRLIDELERF